MPYLYLFISGDGWEAGGLRGSQWEGTRVPDSWISKKSGRRVSLAPTLPEQEHMLFIKLLFFCVGVGREGKEAWVFVQKREKPL